MYTVTKRNKRYFIRDDMMISLKKYIDRGILPGSFLRSILYNDFVGALGHADEDNFENVQAYASYLYNETPSLCWGSKEKVAQGNNV